MAYEDRCSGHADITQVNQTQYTCTINPRNIKVQPASPPPSPEYYRPETPDVKPVIEDERRNPIAFSISNILRPEFGVTALRNSKKIEGPKPLGPNHSILYKPYEISKELSQYGYEYVKTKEDFNLPPLGGLRQTVSSIGEKESPKVVEQKRPDSASSIVSSTSSGAVSCGSTDNSSQSSQLWPAWVYCTRYSDRPSSGNALLL